MVAAPRNVEDVKDKATPRTNPAALVLAEVIHAVLWIVELIGIVLLVFVINLTVPLIAEAERWACRVVGGRTPTEYRGPKFGLWLFGRVASGDYWRRDLPVVLSTFLISTVSFAIVFFGGILAATLIVAPFASGPGDSIMAIGEWSVSGGLAHSWWLVPVGILIGVVAIWLLWLLGKARLKVLEALSTAPERERAAQLEGEVTGLRKGRITLVDAFEAERSRIERDLHDGTQQELVALTLKLGAARMAAASQDPAARARVIPLIEDAQSQAEASLAQLRQVVHGIHPAVLTDLGLKAGVEDLCSRSGLTVDTRITGSSEPTMPVATAVYFAISEVLTNTAKHSGTDSATLKMELGDTGVSVVVTDKGKGGANLRRAGHGLAGIAERLEVVGGRAAVESTEGEGTTVRICAPLSPNWQ